MSPVVASPKPAAMSPVTASPKPAAMSPVAAVPQQPDFGIPGGIVKDMKATLKIKGGKGGKKTRRKRK